MKFCSTLGIIAAFGGVLAAAEVRHKTVPAPRIRSVVRTDGHGRLVRTVVVTPRVIQPKAVDIAEREMAETAPLAATVPELVESAAKKYDLDPLLVHSVIQVESGGNPYAISPKGAQGLMQLMPGTARRFGVSNSFDPRENIEGGVRYLKYLSTLFPNDPRLALAAYNAGEGAVWKYNYQIPPYRETEEYVYKVAKKYGQAVKAAAKAKPVQSAAAGPIVQKEPDRPAGPVYAPVQYHVDSEGRLHMQTAPQTATP